jgi:hypothetical protein
VHRSAHLTNDSRERRMLIELSKEFGLLSSLTTYIAIEHRSIEERNDGQPATRRVPVMLASGWGELAEVAGAGAKSIVLNDLRVAPPAQAAAAGGFATRAMPAAPKAKSLLRMISRRRASGPPVPPPPPATADGGSGLLGLCRESDDTELGAVLHDEIAPRDLKARGGASDQTDILHQLLATQTAAGAFEMPDDIKAFARSKFSDWDARQRKLQQSVDAVLASVDVKEKPATIATVDALILLGTVFARESATWKRAADKAIRYLAKLSGRSPAEIENWLVKLLAEN